MFDKKLLRATVFALVLAIGAGPSCAAQTKHVKQLPSGRIEPVVGDIKASPEEEVQLGRQAVAEVEKQLPILPSSSPVSQFVSRLGQKLAAQAPGYKWPFSFKVVNQKEINAFALPGGPIYVNLGTIQMADEAELAGVMAHEISHVVMRHSMREASKSQWIQLGGALGSAVLGGILGNGVGGQLAQMGIQLGAGGVIMKYSREAETEADIVGSQIMYDAGYDPYSMVEFFQVLEKQGGGGGPSFLSDHPNPGNRAQTVSNIIKKFPKKMFARSDSSDFVSMKRTVAGMKPLTAQEIAQQQKQQRGPSGGTVQGGGDIMPAGGFKQLNQGGLSLSYPSNWQVFGGEQGGLTIAPQAGVGEGAIAYGVVINGAQTQQRMNIDTITSQIVESLQRNNPDMQATGRARQIRVNGVSGRSVDLISTSPLQSNGGPVRERDWLVTLPRSDGSVIYMVFIAPEQQFNQLRPTYEQMLKTLRMQ